jgi:hypothetical protein
VAGSCEHGNEFFLGSVMFGNYLVAGELAASQEALKSMQLVN